MILLHAIPEFQSELNEEMRSCGLHPLQRLGDLLLLQVPTHPNHVPVWVRDTWRNVEEISVTSIGEAVKALKSRHSKWVYVSSGIQHRRGVLITEQLNTPREAPLIFPTPLQSRMFGVFTLADRDRLLVSLEPESQVPRGEYEFVETAVPPSRAYLKLWEALTRAGVWPREGERCLDLGSSPGSWTWALAELGAQVISMDRAELDPKVAEHPRVNFRKGNAFTLKPEDLGPQDWIFSDVICYPEKLLELVKQWLASGLCSRFVCTLKFQGQVDPQVVQAFRALPGGRVVHLYQNKHELTWIKV